MEPTDSIWHPYWYNPPYPLSIFANQWGDPLGSPNNGISHTYLNPNYAGYEICIYAFNECDVDTFCCNIPVVPNNVISTVFQLMIMMRVLDQ